MHVIEAALFEALTQSRRPLESPAELKTVDRSEIRCRHSPMSRLLRMAAWMTGLATRLRHPGKHRVQGMN